MQLSHRPAREWVLLLVALAIVGLIIVPWWSSGSVESREELLAKWTPRRIQRLLIGPEQVACYVCTLWGSLILLSRRAEVLRQRRSFTWDLLPTEEGARILPEDARPLSRKVEAMTNSRGSSILANMIRLGLNKYAISKAAPDVAEVVRNQAEVEAARLVTTMNTVNYLAWAIPAIGFLGTVRGLAGGMSMAGSDEADTAAFLKAATDQLGIAFDCTFVALSLSLVLMYFIHTLQRAEEMLIIDCQDYCQEHLLLRLYQPTLG